MDNTFYTHIKILKQAIEHNKLVVFAGAGVSRDAGIPTWNELKNELKKDINVDEDETDALKIAQIYFNERDEKEYIDKVRQILKYKQVKYLPTHELIFKLNPLHVITTNFDDLFEQVIEEKLYPFSAIVKDSDFPFALNTNFLVKVHGDLTEANIVLKEEDFLGYARNHPLFESFIKSVFASKVVLFVGYSFSDPNLQSIIHHVRDILGKKFQYAYLFNSASNIHSSQKGYLKSKGIQLISYREHKKEIESFLNGENSSKVKYYRHYNLSTAGQYTCNFLNFLSQYKVQNEELKNRNFIDKLFVSLDRFNDVVCLDGYFVTSLYPIKTDKTYFNDSVITTDNIELLSLYRDYSKIQNGVMVITNISALGIVERERKEYEIKLNTITKQLNYSGISWLSASNAKHPEKFIPISLKSQNCQCLGCRYLSFKLDEVAEEVNSESQYRDLRDRLLFGYVVYKFGDWEKALKVFSEIAAEAWKAHRYILYYLCKKNIKTLHNLVRGDYRMTEKKREELLSQIKDTDLDMLLNQLTGLSAEEYKLLRIIRDRDVLYDTLEDVNEAYSNIFKTYHHFINGGWSSHIGDSDINKLINALNKLFNFHWNNNIVLDEYKDFTDIAKKGFEGIIISNATSDSYNARLDQFNASQLQLMVLYGGNEIGKALEDFEVNRLHLDEENRRVFVGWAKNFFQSFSNKKSTHGNYLNENIKSQLRFENFRRNCSRYFSNFVVLLSYLELDNELTEGLIDSLLVFLEVQDFLTWPDIENLCLLLEKQPQTFNEAQLSKLIAISKLRKYNFRVERDFWWAVYIVKRDHLENFLISDKKLIDEIISISNSKDWAYQNILVAFYFLTESALRKKVKERILKLLNDNFQISYYEYLVKVKIIDKGLLKEIYIDNLNLQCDIEIRNNLPYWVNTHSGWVRDSIMFLVYFKFKFTGKLLKKINEAPDFVKFALLPNKYDYSNFKVEWLYLYKNRPDVLLNLAKSRKFKAELAKRKSEIADEKLKALVFTYF
ncbi:MAG: SIR2 family protein [Chitinophagales bacterium]|nr:SIR2 family protein [Chitinophagales bacterium]